MMLEEIEKVINEYFPEKWEEENIEYFIGRPRFRIDPTILNRSLNEPVRDFMLRGGKRWRPILFLTTLSLLGLNYKKYLNLAFFIEMIHNATLIIDDIEDGSELRRGRPVCQNIFGIDVAVNVGVASHLLPLRILANENQLTEKQKLKIWKVYTEEMINLYFGQALDINWHSKPRQINLEEYLEMCRLKTGSLIRMASRIASIISKKDEVFEKNLAKFAESIGIAFQVKDDTIDLVGEEEFGENFAGDIKEGKVSLPVIFAMENSDIKSRSELIGILKLHTDDQALLKRAIQIVRQSGAISKAMKFSDNMVESAWSDIEEQLPQNEWLKEYKRITYSFVKKRGV